MGDRDTISLLALARRPAESAPAIGARLPKIVADLDEKARGIA